MALYNNKALPSSFMVMKCIPATEKVIGMLGVLEDKLLHFYDISVPSMNGNTVSY